MIAVWRAPDPSSDRATRARCHARLRGHGPLLERVCACARQAPIAHALRRIDLPRRGRLGRAPLQGSSREGRTRSDARGASRRSRSPRPRPGSRRIGAPGGQLRATGRGAGRASTSWRGEAPGTQAAEMRGHGGGATEPVCRTRCARLRQNGTPAGRAARPATTHRETLLEGASPARAHRRPVWGRGAPATRTRPRVAPPMRSCREPRDAGLGRGAVLTRRASGSR
jgi:hypothetical protein